MTRTSSRRRVARAIIPFAAVAAVVSCTENLPSGPANFAATLSIVTVRDTLVVGDSGTANAVAKDDQGRQIQGLSFTWTSSDPNTIGLASVTPDSGRTQRLIAKRTGPSSVTLALPDARFAATNVTRAELGVVAGIRVLSTKDSTLTSVNDTGFAIAQGLVHANGATVGRSSMGLRWTHLGQHMALVGQGDTVGYIAKSNGADTLIALHDYCLAGAKCADTVVTRVNQQLLLTLSTKNFQAWSFSDSVGPTITLADRRGNGLLGASIRLVPATAADSLLVKISAPIGTSNPATGAMAAPKMIASGNGSAKVYVRGIGADGISVVATDSVVLVVRQVARRVAVEPLRAIVTSNDSIPIRPIARDARGFTIADATITVAGTGMTVNGIWGVPTVVTDTTFGRLTPTLTGVALPSSNPAAPQVAVSIDSASITLLKPDTLVAVDTATRPTSVVILDSTAVPAVAKVVNFSATAGVVPSVASGDANGIVNVTWLPPDTVGTTSPTPPGIYYLTGARATALPMNTLADSAGRIVVRRSIVVKADTSSASKSTLETSTATPAAGSSTTTLTVTLRDRFNNIYQKGLPADFTVTASAGIIGTWTCTNGVCTASYTAPGAPGTVTLNAKINSSNVAMLFSPMTLTIQ
jgi:hypothetical protein